MHLACVTLVKPSIVRKEIAQLSHHPMVIENFRSVGVILGDKIGRSIQLSAWQGWADADSSQAYCPILRQVVISSDKFSLSHVDVLKIYTCVHRIHALNSGNGGRGAASSALTMARHPALHPL